MGGFFHHAITFPQFIFEVSPLLLQRCHNCISSISFLLDVLQLPTKSSLFLIMKRLQTHNFAASGLVPSCRVCLGAFATKKPLTMRVIAHMGSWRIHHLVPKQYWSSCKFSIEGSRALLWIDLVFFYFELAISNHLRCPCQLKVILFLLAMLEPVL